MQLDSLGVKFRGLLEMMLMQGLVPLILEGSSCVHGCLGEERKEGVVSVWLAYEGGGG